jgi:hypothetical protein
MTVDDLIARPASSLTPDEARQVFAAIHDGRRQPPTVGAYSAFCYGVLLGRRMADDYREDDE